MKKVFKKPNVIVLIGLIILLTGVVIGRDTQITMTKLSVNEETGRTYQEELEETAPPDYVIGDKIDINTATADVFMLLPGIGETLANRIVTYREENGPFKSVDDLLNVEGIGESKLNNIRNYLTVE